MGNDNAAAMTIARSLRVIEPIRLRAEVIHGFGRGSTQLGFPTANLRVRWDTDSGETLTAEEASVLSFARASETGIYCAYAMIEGGPRGTGGVHKVAMSMGWNPTFTDVKRQTIEPWLLHQFDEPFYGAQLRLLVCAFVRPEAKFNSLDELITEIRADGDFCSAALDSPQLQHHQHDQFLQPPKNDFGLSESALSVSLGSAASLLTAPPDGCSRLVLVRHGESEANQEGRLCGGGCDSGLTEHGQHQAVSLASELVRISPALKLDVVGSSALLRARATADAIAAQFPDAARLVVEDVQEMAYGELEGVLISQAKSQMIQISSSWEAGDVDVLVGGGESPQDVLDRVVSAISKLLRAYRGRTVLIVGHSWVNKALIAAVGGAGLPKIMSVPQRNCALNVFDFNCDHEGSPVSCFHLVAADLVAETSEARL